MSVRMQNNEVRRMLLEQLAYVEGRSLADIQARIDGAGGDLEIDSKLGQTVAVRVAVLLDMEDLIRPEDQKRQNLTTVNALEELIAKRAAEYERREA